MPKQYQKAPPAVMDQDSREPPPRNAKKIIELNLRLKVAYLTGEYPKPSHTFIQREIAALRSHGVEVCCTSIRQPSQRDLTGSEEQAAFAETFYVLPTAKRASRLIGDHLYLLLSLPKRWFSTLWLALQTGRPGWKGTLWQIFYFLEAGVLARWLQQREVTHLHNHFGDSSASVAMLTSALSGIPFSFTLHGPTEFFAPEAWRLDVKIARASSVICITHFARSQAMIFSSPRNWHKLHIVHCGVTPERYAGRAVSSGRAFKLLFVGRLTPLKGLRVLFAALENVRAKIPEISLTVIGDGQDRQWAEAEARRIGGIAILGLRSQTDVAQTILESDALVLPSFAEGLPVVLMEALAAGRPVIASRIAGVSELVEDGVSGVLVAPGDQTGLEEAILRVALDPIGREKMGAEGRRRVRQSFDSRVEARKLLEVFLLERQ